MFPIGFYRRKNYLFTEPIVAAPESYIRSWNVKWFVVLSERITDSFR